MEQFRLLRYSVIGILSCVLLLVVTGCTTTQKGAGIGSAIGAGAGAIIGHQSGKTTEGAVIGAAVGGLGGALIGEKAGTKFCPTGGETYPADVEYCPKHGTKLEYKK